MTTEPAFGQGSAIDLASVPPHELKRALDEAFDYRGDVTLTLDDGSRVECYIFDRREGPSLDSSIVRVMLTGGGEKVTLPYARLRRLEFTGKDTAAGKTWENWVRRYVEKHRAGERASIESETLD
jgi:hypothetical protein